MRTSRRILAAAIGLTAAVALAGVAAQASEGTVVAARNPVPGSYLVTLADGAAAASVAGRHGATITHVYRAALRGFAATMSERQARRLAADPAVARVEQDGQVRALAPASWGLDRIDQRHLPLDGRYAPPTAASRVTAYIIDTGIYTGHSDFAGRARIGADFVGDGRDGQDCNGHGTHVAGTVGGTAYGVAKGVRLVAVRVLNCIGSGTYAGVITGVDWVTANAVMPAVANMSLGGGGNTTVDDAVARSIASGVSYAVTAGNSNSDACDFSPARAPAAITVASTDRTDTRASSANYGRCLDIFAPGREIASAWIGAPDASRILNGASMASAHAAGGAALILGLRPWLSPGQVRDTMVRRATRGVVRDPGPGSPNALLYVGA